MRNALSQIVHRVAPVLRSTWFLGLLVGLASWPSHWITPATQQDGSWQFLLHLAAEQRLEYGTELIYTYGPLGFLEVPLIAYDAPAVLSALYALALQVTLGATLIWVLRRNFGTLVSFPLAVLVACLMSHLWVPGDAIISLIVIWSLVALADDPPPFSRNLVAVGGGFVSAVMILAKLNAGILILAVCGVAVVALQADRPRTLRLFAVTFSLALAALWFATGQSIASIDDYLRGVTEVISGYQRGHTIDVPAVSWALEAALAIAIATLAGALVATRALPRLRRAAVVAIVLLVSFALFKQAFVFQVFINMPLYVSTFLAVWLAFRWRDRARYVLLAAIASLTLLYFPLAQGGFVRPGMEYVLQLQDNAEAAVDELHTLLAPGAREAAREQSRTSLQAGYALEPEALAHLGGRPTAITPWEYTLAWAYDLNLQPLPVLASLTIYTPYLDQLGATALNERGSPERLLRHRPGLEGIDFRYGPWEGAATNLAMLCHYTALYTSDRYQVLGRSSDRCGQPREIATRAATYGEAITVPPARGKVVLADVDGLAPSGMELVQTAFWRSAFRFVVLDDDSRFRIFPDINEQLIVSAPAQVDFPAPFALAGNPRTIEFERGPGLGVAEELEVTFYALPVSRVGPAGATP